MATTTFPALQDALERTNLGYETSITETTVANTDYAVLMDDNNQIKLALITDLIGDADITINDDNTLSFGDSDDVSMSWTGQELLVEDTRTIDVSDGYNRTIHVGNTITMTASRYAAVSCYTTVVGTGGLDAYGAKFSMVQNAAGAVTGHYGAVMAEVKNTVNSTACCTASALFCRWDNDATSGFGGDQSFIRCEDNSSQTKVKYLLDGLTLSTAADSTEVLFRTGGHAANNIVNKAGIHIRINGAAYYIPCIAEAEWVDD